MSLRRRHQPPAPVSAEHLTWSTRRHGDDLLISLRAPRREGERGFVAVDVLAAAEADGRTAAVAAALTQAGEAGEMVALQGFRAPRPDAPPLTFTLAVSLADLPHPEAADLPEGNLAQFDLPCGPGVRVQRLAREPAGPEPEAAELVVFAATYLAQTDHGVIALAFATPHVDGAPEFAVLFDSIAGSCELAVG